MAKKIQPELPASTEEKIKEAARKVFTQKGFAGTRTRDIAEAAGINLALLNYYFRSKENLFRIIMIEKVQKLLSVILPVLINEETTLENKLDEVITGYIDMISEMPDLPMFVLNEIRNNPSFFETNMQGIKAPLNLAFFRQLKEVKPDLNPAHFLLNILGMTVFPFVAKPIISAAGVLTDTEFNQLMQERKTLIPAWVKGMLR